MRSCTPVVLFCQRVSFAKMALQERMLDVGLYYIRELRVVNR